MTHTHKSEILRAIPNLRAPRRYGSGAPLAGIRAIIKQVNEARRVLGSRRLADFAEWLSQSGIRVGCSAFPKTPKSIHVVSNLEPTQLSREIAFAVGTLRAHADRLSGFPVLERNYEEAIAAEDYPRALDVVLEVDRALGTSLWTSTQALAPFGAVCGLEAQKELMQSIRRASSASGLVQYFVFHASMRAEPAVTPLSYDEAVVRTLAQISDRLPPEWVSLCVRHLVPFLELTPDAASQVLALEVTGTAVDCLQSLRWALLIAAHNDACDPETTDLVEELAQIIDDQVLVQLVTAIRTRSALGSPLRFTPSQATYCQESRVSTAWATVATIDELDSEGQDSPFVLALGPNGPDPYRDIMRKRALQHPYSLQMAALAQGILAETSEELATEFGETLLAVASGCGEPSTKWPPTTLGRLDEAAWNLESGDLAAADVALAELNPSARNLWYRRWNRLFIDLRMRQGRLHDALAQACVAAIQAPNIVESLPLAALASSIDKKARRTIAKAGPELAVFYDLLCRHRNTRAETERRHAAEDYLRAHKVGKPSSLRTVPAAVETLSPVVLAYFLEEVCVETVIDKFRAFNGPREVAEERVEICRWLSELTDSESSRAEITAILRRLMIAEGMERLQRSKVFVGLDGFRQAAIKKTRENYERFVALSDASPDEDHRTAIEAVRRKVEEGSHEEFLALTLPDNERAELMTRIVTTLRDEFVYGPHHGLDGYLSVRIRHGAVRNFLRAPFDEEGLSTVKAESREGYENNPRWDDFLSLMPSQQAEEGREILKGLAKRLDEQVGEVNQWLQVTTTGSGGLFDFSLGEQALAVFLDSGTIFTLEEFVEQIEIVFLAMLDRNLESIRARITGEAKRRAAESVRQAHRAFEEFEPYNAGISEVLARLNRLHTSVQNTVETLAEWFQRTPAIASEPFAIEDPIRIAAETVRRGPSAIIPSIDNSDPDAALIHGVFFQPLADVFALVIDNAVRHSGLEDPDLRVSIRGGEGQISFAVTNQMTEGAAETASERVGEITARLSDESRMAYVRREGGSGIYKLHKILVHDLGVKPDLRIEVHDLTFSVSFQITTRIPTE